MVLTPFHNRYKLLNAHADEDVSENCLLYSVVHHFLREEQGNPSDNEEFTAICNYIVGMMNVETGKFNNIPNVTTGKDRYISHDQFIALCSFSYFHDLEFHKMFWYGINKFTYDNLTGKFNIHRIVHPINYIFVGYLNRNIICTLLMPLFCVLTMFSFHNDVKVRPTFWERLKGGFRTPATSMLKTDGQIISFVRFACIKKLPWIMKKTWQWCMNLCDNRYINGYQTLFDHYYDKNHPNNTLSKSIKAYVV